MLVWWSFTSPLWLMFWRVTDSRYSYFISKQGFIKFCKCSYFEGVSSFDWHVVKWIFPTVKCIISNIEFDWCGDTMISWLPVSSRKILQWTLVYCHYCHMYIYICEQKSISIRYKYLILFYGPVKLDNTQIKITVHF